jgi:hypothetical protein
MPAHKGRDFQPQVWQNITNFRANKRAKEFPMGSKCPHRILPHEQRHIFLIRFCKLFRDKTPPETNHRWLFHFRVSHNIPHGTDRRIKTIRYHGFLALYQHQKTKTIINATGFKDTDCSLIWRVVF